MRPEGREKRNSINFVYDKVKAGSQLAIVAAKRMEVDGPLATGPHDVDAIQVLFGCRTRERSTEPLNLIANRHKALGYFVSKEFGPPGARIFGTTPVEDKNSHRSMRDGP